MPLVYALWIVIAVMWNCTFVFLFAYTQTMAYLTLKREVRYNEAYAKTAYQWYCI